MLSFSFSLGRQCFKCLFRYFSVCVRGLNVPSFAFIRDEGLKYLRSEELRTSDSSLLIFVELVYGTR